MDSANPLIGQLIANREKILRYAFIFQFIAAVPLLWFGYHTGKTDAMLLLNGKPTTGTVVAVVPVQFSSRSSSSSSGSHTAYEAVVSFAVADRQFRFQEWKATSVAPSIGTRVPVIYNPAHPGAAMVDRGYLNYVPWAPCAVIGLFLFIVATKGFLTLLLRG